MIQDVLGIEGERRLQVEVTECMWVGPKEEWKRKNKYEKPYNQIKEGT